MHVRLLVALAIGAAASACAAVPDVEFVPDDAAAPDSTTVIDEDAGLPSFDAAAGADSPATGGPDAKSDARIDAADGAPSSGDSSTCPPPGAPAGTACCPNGNACIGPACAHCDQCHCATTLYCCATENGGGHFQSTNCSASPTGAQCPPN